ncbi:hypothetical protein DTO013E5_1833 [Penicillium roqueforti]|uniref:uncharacterized protein n=1 Tax=Penicillium roqueforti TaxID=5082 RepID=UPI00190C9244|nr:uncharacterized protein LCP9604111_211 [Penicillium roqueforti]KAF9252685.1 hypothetical protein LCP9604111_211 [Penicillium roqueforti]KAI1835740.1 hypothetical protein CBS147337_3763 [Penicillium roqueforti]KAI2675409.1 hypothetical protein CBS147355_6403 [Penicillium roqueforti]KAI2687024.1 hypothetical protein LCP963914a_3625 [Penicillium roqueforti]KAI2698368.1 hypothetical protein CBS147372_6898 [Penicillium roqueforti]
MDRQVGHLDFWTQTDSVFPREATFLSPVWDWAIRILYDPIYTLRDLLSLGLLKIVQVFMNTSMDTYGPKCNRGGAGYRNF